MGGFRGLCVLVVIVLSVFFGITCGVSSRLPRTSAGQLAAAAAAKNKTSAELRNSSSKTTISSTIGPPPGRGSTSRAREQYLFTIFEAIISTLDSKLQRIENLDKAVEHLMRRVENLDSRVTDNIDKTDFVISKLKYLDLKLFNGGNSYILNEDASGLPESGPVNVNQRLITLDEKVGDIDDKLKNLKNQVENNYLPGEDINVEASEKKPISLNVVEITKALNTEVMNHVSKELDQLRTVTMGVDRKLQFHIGSVTDNLSTIARMVTEVHEAIVEPEDRREIHFRNYRNHTTTTAAPFAPRGSKIDALVKQIKPIISVSEKMDEVWDVVVGTKSSVDDLLPKSDELLTHTQRQERAIGEIHSDLRSKTNKIIANLDMVEKRLKKQEDDVANLAQRPVPPELLSDPTIDRLVEYDPNRYNVDDYSGSTDTTLPVTYTTFPPTTIQTTTPSQINSTLAATFQTSASNSNKRADKRKGGVIYPNVKNKPSPGNSTFTTDSINFKDIKGYSCVDLLNAGMRESEVYYLQIRGTTYWFLKVFCEQEIADGGWTVIQRRDEFGEPRENFNRDWNDYKNGFGDPAKEFWLGNENIYMLTNNEEYILRVELEDFEGNKRYAQYSHFKIYSEAEYYKLEIDGYEGNGGDSLNDPWYGSNHSPFSTYNRDNDRSSLNCASMLKGGWWWKSCGRGLNGLYLHDPQDLTARQGIVWFRWRGWDYTLKKAVMMIKPKGIMNTSTPAN